MEDEHILERLNAAAAADATDETDITVIVYNPTTPFFLRLRGVICYEGMVFICNIRCIRCTRCEKEITSGALPAGW